MTQVNKEQVEAVLIALGEEFLVDVPALHDGKGGYLIDFFELSHRLVDPEGAWVERIQGYVNTKEFLNDNDAGDAEL